MRFKKGDTVRRINKPWKCMKVGDIDTIFETTEKGLRFKNRKSSADLLITFDANNYTLHTITTLKEAISYEVSKLRKEADNAS